MPTQKEKVVNGKSLILRRKYLRKAYHRKPYVRKNGTKVRATYVKSTKVKASWIPKRGLTHGKYGLIPLKDLRHLRTFGYSFSKSSSQRHSALKKAIEKYGRNWVVRRLTALANVQPQLPKYTKVSKKARRDVMYIQDRFPSRTALRRGKSYTPRGLAKNN